MKLFLQAIIKFLIGLLIVYALLFIPAGVISYYNAWLLIILLFVPMFFVGIILLFKNPELLKKRLDAREKEKDQKEVIIISGIMFIVGFIISGLNFRYKWIIMNNIFVLIGVFIFIISYIMYAFVLKENSYLSRTIKVEKNQKVIDSGLYSIVRHPMYTSTIFLFLSMPLILNCFIAFIIFLIYPILIIKRIKNEEEVLNKQLKGYNEYTKKVKYKLIPYIF